MVLLGLEISEGPGDAASGYIVAKSMKGGKL